jgi:2,3-dimethylmalate lyase
MRKFERLRANMKGKIEKRELIVAPGAYDALSARVIERAGFEAAFLTGHGVGAGLLAWSDVGLTTQTEMVWTTRNICNAVNIPLIADIDTGYGNAVNVVRAVRDMEQAGAWAVQLEDQVEPKKCGFMHGKLLIPMDEMVGKIKAAIEAREDQNFLLVVRCDARAVLGADELYRRCDAYYKAGADVMFLEAPLNDDDIQRDAKWAKQSGAPLYLNAVRYGYDVKEIAALGCYAIMILPIMCFPVAAKAMYDVLVDFKKTGQYVNLEQQGKAFSFNEVQEIIRLPEVKKYEETYLPKDLKMARWGSEKVPPEAFRGLGPEGAKEKAVK